MPTTITGYLNQPDYTPELTSVVWDKANRSIQFTMSSLDVVTFTYDTDGAP